MFEARNQVKKWQKLTFLRNIMYFSHKCRSAVIFEYYRFIGISLYKRYLQSSITTHRHPRPPRTVQTANTKANIVLRSSISAYQPPILPRLPRTTQTANAEAKIVL